MATRQHHLIILAVSNFLILGLHVAYTVIVGYLAQAIQAIEASPFTSRLTNNNPTTVYLKSTALNSKSMPLSLRKAILDPSSSTEVLKYMDSSLERRALVRTSTAVDIMRGGEKGEAPIACNVRHYPIGLVNQI